MGLFLRIGSLPVLLIGLALGGCQMSSLAGLDAAFAPRDFARRSEPPARQPAQSSAPRIYLIRGLAQTVSEGVDHLAVKLNRLGYRASVHAFGDWRQIVEQIAADQSASGGRQKAVLVGHSLGANSTIEAANALAARGASAQLAVTFDPTQDLTVTGGAPHFINFYQSNNGWGRRVQAAPGLEDLVENVDLAAMAHLTHFTLDRDAQVHQRVISWIRRSVGEGDRNLARANRVRPER
ncbi:hypothetical protein [Phreatobacter stygius]|uniref:Alpha/beta hydrolase n=1 Tax=Phreatobacter stygius TaxID=1940610 RepID=A0A4D7AXA6_9HYPH|nr:hypothetical protein [Phreatobacter stygius]QCI63553.1 hypothetical protein E8M01_04460 [Phreatobacter stygius]